MSKLVNQYPEDALLDRSDLDVINCSDVHTLDELFRERVRRSPEKVAYTQYDNLTKQWIQVAWSEIATQVERWQVAMREQGLSKGDRVAIRYRNSIEWVIFDQAALRLGLVVVPLYIADRPDNISYVLQDCSASLIFLSNDQEWQEIAACGDDLSCIKCVIIQQGEETELVKRIDSWLPEVGQHLERGLSEPNDLASIVYTSGTTGRPKGVMLSHKNILSNAYNGMRSVALTTEDRLLSFLPLSHTFERTIGYYAPMLCGSMVAYNRSISELAEDLKIIKPTVTIAVPRIFERVYNKLYAKLETLNPLKQWLFNKTIQVGWRRFQYNQGLKGWHISLLAYPILRQLVAKPVHENLGGNLAYAVVGGAPLSLDVSKTFLALDICLLQGYGLTEASPVISVNTQAHHRPDSIGLLLRGVEACIAEDNELWVKGDNVMQGYWNNPDATADVMDSEWLKTGDKAAVDEQGFLRIIGRIKDILVLANGEKVPPSDIEAAIAQEPLFEQVLVTGEGKPFLAALLVVNKNVWQEVKAKHGFELNDKTCQEYALQLIAQKMQEFPGYARIRRVHMMLEEWTVESGLLTPTLKLKRNKIISKYEQYVEKLYQGH